ncbi:MAG TPA: hypothetical protein VFC56_14905 [Stellaceae bacterium]|nr:hypothetical protein [Stellaceae bacterium]
MGDFKATFVKAAGLEETFLGSRDLDADTLEAASIEALACPRPAEANMIDLYREGQKVDRIGIAL